MPTAIYQNKDYLTEEEIIAIQGRIFPEIDYENDDPVYIKRTQQKPKIITTAIFDEFTRRNPIRNTLGRKQKINIDYYGKNFDN